MNFVGRFWATFELLVAQDDTYYVPFESDVENWLQTILNRFKQLRPFENYEDLKVRYDKNETELKDLVDYRSLIECTFRPTYGPVRSRLEKLMGSNVVRLTDRKYMLKLMSKIREDYELEQRKRIEERKSKELMRTKSLVLSRYIPVEEAPSDLQQNSLFKLYVYCDALLEQRRKKVLLKKVKITDSLHGILYPETLKKEGEDETDEDVHMKEVIVNGVAQLVPMTPEEVEKKVKAEELARDLENGYMMKQEEYESLRYETDAVKKLKESKTVNEMYAKANDIVGQLFTWSELKKRKKCELYEESKRDDTESIKTTKTTKTMKSTRRGRAY